MSSKKIARLPYMKGNEYHNFMHEYEEAVYEIMHDKSKKNKSKINKTTKSLDVNTMDEVVINAGNYDIGNNGVGINGVGNNGVDNYDIGNTIVEMVSNPLEAIDEDLIILKNKIIQLTQNRYHEQEADIFYEIEKIYNKGLKLLVESEPSDHLPVLDEKNKIVSWNLENETTFIEPRLGILKSKIKEYMSRELSEQIVNINGLSDQSLVEIKYNKIIDELKRFKREGYSQVYFQECDKKLFDLIENEKIYSYNKILLRNFLKLKLKSGLNIQNYKQEVANIFIGKDIKSMLENYDNELFKSTQQELVQVFNKYFEENNELRNNYGVGLLSEDDFILIPIETFFTYGSEGTSSNNLNDSSLIFNNRNCLIINLIEENLSEICPNFTINDKKKKTNTKIISRQIVINCHSRIDYYDDIKNYIKGNIFNYSNFINGFYEELFDKNDKIPGILNYISDEMSEYFNDIESMITKQMRKTMLSICNSKLHKLYPQEIEIYEPSYDYKEAHFLSNEYRDKIKKELGTIHILGDFNKTKDELINKFLSVNLKYKNDQDINDKVKSKIGWIKEIINKKIGYKEPIDHIITVDYSNKNMFKQEFLEELQKHVLKEFPFTEIKTELYKKYKDTVVNNLSFDLTLPLSYEIGPSYYYNLLDVKNANIVYNMKDYINIINNIVTKYILKTLQLGKKINERFKTLCDTNPNKKIIILIEKSIYTLHNEIWDCRDKDFENYIRFTPGSAQLFIKENNNMYQYNMSHEKNKTGTTIICNIDTLIQPEFIIKKYNKINEQSGKTEYIKCTLTPLYFNIYERNNLNRLTKIYSNNEDDLFLVSGDPSSYLDTRCPAPKEDNEHKIIDRMTNYIILVAYYAQNCYKEKDPQVKNRYIEILSMVKEMYPWQLYAKNFYQVNNQVVLYEY